MHEEGNGLYSFYSMDPSVTFRMLLNLQMTEEYFTRPSDTNKWMKTIALGFCNIPIAVKNRAHSLVFIGLR